MFGCYQDRERVRREYYGKLRDECLNRELLLNLTEARYIADRWRLDYNHHRPHSMLKWKTSAKFAARCHTRRRSCAASGSPLLADPSQHTKDVKTLT